MKPSLSFSTALASMELASLAKSRSRISDTGTDTMAKASLSSLVGHVPSCRDKGQQGARDPPAGPSPTTRLRTMSRIGRSSSTSMGALVLWIHVLVQRCRSRTYEFLVRGHRASEGGCHRRQALSAHQSNTVCFLCSPRCARHTSTMWVLRMGEPWPYCALSCTQTVVYP